jgi:membrane-associated phospholipid phosphatase
MLVVLLVLPKPARAADPTHLEWSDDWPRVRWWEVLNIVALTVASVEIDSHWHTARSAIWRGGILFDDLVRNALRGRTASAEQTASQLSDILYQVSVYAPYAVDNYFVALSLHQNADVALQLTLMDMQSLGIAGVLTLSAERIPRERPFPHDCGRDGNVRDGFGEISESCGHGDDYKSFYSGHAAATATMAGLTCVHHQHLPLYGGGVADLVPCLVMTAIAATTGIARVVADRHWASDVMLGWGVGVASGYVLPSVMHYGWGKGGPLGEMSIAGARITPIPEVLRDGAGLRFAGVF